MLLYVLRHANADVVASSDFERWLTDKGITQARAAGKFCKRHGLTPDLILTSPLVRARQTAEFCAEELGASKPQEAAFLASGMDPGTALENLQGYMKLESLMIVGHEPDLSMLLACLLGLADAANLNVTKGSLTVLEVSAMRPGAATLLFSLPNRLMRS